MHHTLKVGNEFFSELSESWTGLVAWLVIVICSLLSEQSLRSMFSFVIETSKAHSPQICFSVLKIETVEFTDGSVCIGID